jgi:hypothetical protein
MMGPDTPPIVLAVLGIVAVLPIGAIMADTLARRWWKRSWRAAVIRGRFFSPRARRARAEATRPGQSPAGARRAPTPRACRAPRQSGPR